MKKFLIILCSIIFTIIVGLFLYSAYLYYVALHIDDPIDPFLKVEQWNATVVRWKFSFDIEKDWNFWLLENDSIVTYTGSEATIFWPDRSITQIWENSQFHIHKMQVAQDYSKIEIEASLLDGKIYSTIVRTLYPESYLRVKLPNQNTIAWVRGTEFSINLEKNYIHSIDHSITLENNNLNIFGKKFVLVMPGEIVSASNILEKLTQEIIDKTWEYSSNIKNSNYIQEHSQNIENSWKKISWILSENNYWDIFVRKILSYFDSFNDLEIAKKINSLDINQISEIPTEFLLKYYQKFKIWDFAKERDILRWAIIKISEIDKNMINLVETLTIESLWDKLDFPTINLENSTKILDKYSNKTSQKIEEIINNISNKNYNDELIKSLENLFTY